MISSIANQSVKCFFLTTIKFNYVGNLVATSYISQSNALSLHAKSMAKSDRNFI